MYSELTNDSLAISKVCNALAFFLFCSDQRVKVQNDATMKHTEDTEVHNITFCVYKYVYKIIVTIIIRLVLFKYSKCIDR